MSLPIRICVLTCLAASFLAGCDRPAAEPAPAKANRVWPFALVLTAQPATSFTVANGTVTAETNAFRIEASSDDPQMIFPLLNTTGEVALALDIDAPAETTLELFYATKQAPQFGSDRVLGTPLHRGRNHLLLVLHQADFNGALRLDPGQVQGTYLLHSAVVFASNPISVIVPERSQAELAAAFEAAKNRTYAAHTPDELARLRPLKDVELAPAANGVTLHATGNDPGLLLPGFDLGARAIVKIVLTSPAATVLQLFYKHEGQADYIEAQARSQTLAVGANTVYLDLTDPASSGALRLDPGTVPGDYILQSIEVRAEK